ncbi:MAG: hypothetical protein HYV19_13520 [Gemmatimonadetes bacterium]|nr:hypothetical protein [Gemmatimonadota bacterium]
MMPMLAFAELVPMATHGAPAVHLASIQPGEVLVAAIVFGTMGTVLYPLARALARRLEAGARGAPPGLLGVEERLDRIERSVESIAVEVERVSEGQRFVTKLLAERSPDTRPRLES